MSWIVKRSDWDSGGESYLIGGPFVPGSIRTWLAWGGRAQAYVFRTKAEAYRAARSRRVELEQVPSPPDPYVKASGF